VAAAQPLTYTTDDARVIVDPAAGGRIASFFVSGREVLVTEPGPLGFLGWGSFPMAPFAGRIRDGRFQHAGSTWTLERNLPPHAIHGTVAGRAWDVDDDRTLSTDLGPAWPFRGRVVQRFDLRPGRLEIEMELHADELMPATIGWHPWFRWRIDEASAGRGPQAEVDLDAAAMYERDDVGIAIDRLVAPKPPPWDDCFVGLRRPPMARWPGLLELELGSSCPAWVVFTEWSRGFCIEPQTGPPDAANIGPVVVRPGSPLGATMSWSWRIGNGP
jgi:aldose 1-epimerase